MIVPDDLLLAFFRESTSRLNEIDPEAAVVATATENSDGDGDSHLDLADCRRCVLNHQKLVLKEVTYQFQKQQHNNGNNGGNSASDNCIISPTQVQERLGRLQHEPDLSPELKAAMEDMNDAARVGVCKLVLYTEEATTSSRNLQDEGRLERTKMMEYFVLCKASIQLQCVVKFLSMTGGDLIFGKEEEEPTAERNSDNTFENKKSSSSAVMLFPQSRLEYVQRLLAKGMGWDPVFVTSELRKIFVEKPGDIDYGYYDNEVMVLFQQLVEQMTIAIRMATLHVRSKQDTELLNDLGKGGNTRVVSVQYSEFEVDQYGTKIESKNNAPEKGIDERQQLLTEEEQKQQLRLASEAAMLQQTILGELLTMDEDERNHTLNEAAEASRKFMEEVMALPMGQERIDFVRSVDAATQRKLAMHKLWNGMLQANGGKPPKIVPQK
jgi:hypothetical protein